MILQVNDISFSYESNRVLDGTTFRLDEGTLTALLGVNGAGKSTLLKCCNGILKPVHGNVLIDGSDIREMERNRIAQSLGYVPQNSSDNNLTVMDTVLMGRRPHSPWGPTAADEEIAMQVLSLLHLEEMANRPITTLSGGEARKAVIGRALAQDPRVMLLDEPTNSLDLKNQVELMKILRHLVESHRLTIIASIHDINLALRYADLIIMLKDKKIVWSGKPLELTPASLESVYNVAVDMVYHNGIPVVITKE